MTDASVTPPTPPPPPRPTRLAAIDIGTNSIRFVVAEVEANGSYRVLDEEREMTRLGHDLFERGRLAAEPMERSYAALAKMKAIADGFQVDELRAVATSAVREASNGRAFCREVRRRSGLAIEIISPDEEAQLALLSALRSFDLAGRSVAIVDIGGGSVEVVLAAGAVVDQVYTLPLGAVRLTEAYGGAEPLKRRRWKRLRRAIDRVLDERIGDPPFYPEVIIGSGGTFTNLAGLIKTEREGSEKNIQGYTMRRAEIVHLMHRLRGTPLEMRRTMPGLNPQRADIIVAGSAVVARLAKRLGAQQIVVNPGGLRSGLLLSMIAERQVASGAGAEHGRIDRMESVRAFARKCRSGERHCEHVAQLAGQVFDGLRGPYGLPLEGRDMLVAAALLHDVGYLINHAKHHKHAYHLIQNAELQGWTAREVELIANVARYHRKASPKKRHANYRRLERGDRRQVRRLAAILRVVDGLDRTHTQRITAVGVEAGRGPVRLILAADSDPQVERWDADRKAGLFAKVFDGVPAFVWARGGAVQRRRTTPARGRRAPPLRLATG